MRISLKPSRREHGSALVLVVIIGAIMCITTMSMLRTSSNSVSRAYDRVDWNKAFFCAENATVWAAQKAFDTLPATGSSNYYSTAAGTLPVSYVISTNGSDAGFQGAWVSVVQATNSAKNVVLITSSARVNNKVRTVQSLVTIRPVSQVFDYEYFLNNWGWWWGSSITGNGGQRSNWDFDFKYNPVVNGAIYAGNEVDDNGTPVQNLSTPPFGGLAGADMTNLVHQGAQRVTMPNLLNFSNYIATALANTASNGLWIGSTQVVAGVWTNSSTPGKYLAGTTANPIRIKGTVVVSGDVVIKGQITGQGTLYVGGNLYVANDITYTNGPDFSSLPETQSATNRDAWVQSNQSKDLVAYAVRGSILAGDVTDSDWIANCYDMSGSGLAKVGDESQLGQNGIDEGGGGDDKVPFSHPADSTHASAYMSTWYDADGDGTVNANYNYSTDINMDSTRANKISGYPKDASNNPKSYDNIATDNMGTMEGVFYTNHAAAMRLTKSDAIFHGCVISRNEQIIFQNYMTMIYDSRVHSRYANNPNNVINLGLPWGRPLQVNSFTELNPDPTGL
jgi:hypothetical protein